MQLTGHAEVFGLLSLMTTFGAGRGFSFLLFVNFTLGVLVAETGLPEHQKQVKMKHITTDKCDKGSRFCTCQGPKRNFL